MTVSSYADFVSHLGDREYFGQKLGLERVRNILASLDNPHLKFRSIHIAGTNGKGSTAAMTAMILRKAGFRVGLFTSPHLEDFCERIQINGELISPNEVIRLLGLIQEKEEPHDRLTFFELVTVMGFLYFAQQKVDFAIIETGLGGRLDATNVIRPLLSLITSIGLDHTAYLGNSVKEIASEKAGIIKKGVPVLVGSRVPSVALTVIQEKAKQEGTICFQMKEISEKETPLSLAGDHQKENAQLASAAADLLRKTYFIAISDEAVSEGLKEVTWLGRLETVSEKPWILLDGAHNPEAMRAVRAYVEKKLQGRRLFLLFAAMADKDVSGMLAEILPIASRVILTQPSLKRAASVESLTSHIVSFQKECVVIPDVSEALKKVITYLEPNDALLITGTFFLVGEARSLLRRIL